MKDEKVTLSLTKSQCRNLAEFLEFCLIRYIREDDELDNILWLCDMVDAFRLFDEVGKGDGNA